MSHRSPQGWWLYYWCAVLTLIGRERIRVLAVVPNSTNVTVTIFSFDRPITEEYVVDLDTKRIGVFVYKYPIRLQHQSVEHHTTFPSIKNLVLVIISLGCYTDYLLIIRETYSVIVICHFQRMLDIYRLSVSATSLYSL